MPLNIPTTKTLRSTFLTFLENALNQSSPLADKAFTRVISAVFAGVFTILYKFAAQEAKENLAISASRAGLIKLGAEYDLPIKPAEATILTITLPAVDGTIIPQTVDFQGDANGLRYLLSANSNPATSSLITMQVTCKVTGAQGNLAISDTLTIGTQVAGAETVATVTVVDNLGADEEATEAYRARLLSAIRSPGGGGNAADYRNWTLETTNVVGAYPYSGTALGGSPPDRTVYVEADTSIDPDGIAPPSLLVDVRTSITTDPETGLSRQPLGMTDATLFIESITRIPIYVQITNLVVDPLDLAQVKADLDTSLTTYFFGLSPWIDGLDPVFEKNDEITNASISKVAFDVVHAAGGSYDNLAFGLAPGVFAPSHILNFGEHAKLGTITYA
jgi:hypothetical protein